ncbi:MAG: rhamnogalacturonan lyase [Verrucomicrobia bacterium]|nr:rhamnogalacturonan lyase [Verrucomicrobiota bacterium]
MRVNKCIGWFLLSVMSSAVLTATAGQWRMENLDRGLIALRNSADTVFIGWRLLGKDSEDTVFNLYRVSDGGDEVKLNDQPLTNATCYIDANADFTGANEYFIRPVLNGGEGDRADSVKLNPNPSIRSYIPVPLETPQGYRPNDASVGDLDGDGKYEIVLHQAGRGRDNSQDGFTDSPILQAYELDGTLLWTIDLGRNIREGAHYTQFMVYDLDGDGAAEVACKTADGTVDGTGEVIGDRDADYRGSDGYILEGPEFLTVFDGRTGAALATADYIPARGDIESWGDDYGNRVDRFLACVAYLDGERPSLVMCRGYYERTTLAAWNWRDGMLTNIWTFDTGDGSDARKEYAGQGDHSLSVGDVDGDGRDEIVYGACTIDNDGTGLYSTGLGHGDALHMSDMDPTRPGMEIFNIHERPRHRHGVELRDAATGELIWSKEASDPGRGLAMDIDPRYPGYEAWAYGGGARGLWDIHGETISIKRPRSCNFGVWWDGDLLRELLDRNYIAKWNWEEGTETRLLTAEDCVSNNGSKANPCLCADILGDWREEVIWRTRDNDELRIFTTTLPTNHRMPTLMHDRQYRLSIAWQNVGYNQPAHPGFYLGADMDD